MRDNGRQSGIKVGSMVCLRANPSVQGLVREVRTRAEGRTDYLVFFSHNNQGWYAEDSLLVVVDSGREEIKTVGAREFLKNLAVIKLQSQLTDTLYSYLASRTNIEPYQFKPALKFLENPNQRMILADEVGLGKTIEAGIIYLELKARLDLQRVLVVCPAGLIQKWREEMLNRFGEEFTKLDTRGFLEFLDRYDNQSGLAILKGIISLEAIRRQDVREKMEDVGLHLDLAIVDEAHHMRNPSALQYAVGLSLSDAADALLLLTATPIQLASHDLFHLLHILDEGEFESLTEFQQLLEPNIHINRAVQLLSPNPESYAQALKELRRVESTTQKQRYLSNRFYHHLCGLLSDPPIDHDRKRFVEIRRGIQNLNTLARVFNRTTKREVSPGTPRSAHIVDVALTPEEHDFYEAVLEYALDQYRRRSAGRNAPPPLGIIQRERQAASCIAAAREYILGSISKPGTTLDVEESYTGVAEDEDRGGPSDSLQNLQGACDALGEKDSKFEKFLESLKSIYVETPDSKVLIFSFFKRTLNYLHQKLRELEEFRDGLWMIHGDIPSLDRRPIIDQFRKKEGFGVLLLSELGAEGLDFQFCDVIINYDLPWNPMRVEQRIGRVDRYGQTHDRVRIFSFIIRDTIEERILKRLYSRIRIFEESIGDLEPILGEELSLLERDIFKSRLSPREEIERVEAILSSIEFKRQESEKFREEQARLMGQDIIFKQQMEEITESGRYVSPAETRALVECFLQEKFGGVKLEANKNEPRIFSFKTTPRFLNHISQYMIHHRYPVQIRTNFVQKAENPRGFPITFDGQFALQRPLLELFNINHPVVKSSYQHFHQTDLSVSSSHIGLLQAEAPKSLKGNYNFFVYTLHSEGVERHSMLEPIVLDQDGKRREDVESRLMSFLQDSKDLDASERSDIDWIMFQRIAYEVFAQERDNYQNNLSDRNNALIDTRIAGLEQTFYSKRRRLIIQTNEVTDPRIKRMREGQISRLENELAAKIEGLNQRRAVTVGGDLVLSGYLRLTPIPAEEASERHIQRVEDLMVHVHDMSPTVVSDTETAVEKPVAESVKDVPQIAGTIAERAAKPSESIVHVDLTPKPRKKLGSTVIERAKRFIPRH